MFYYCGRNIWYIFVYVTWELMVLRNVILCSSFLKGIVRSLIVYIWDAAKFWPFQVSFHQLWLSICSSWPYFDISFYFHKVSGFIGINVSIITFHLKISSYFSNIAWQHINSVDFFWELIISIVGKVLPTLFI